MCSRLARKLHLNTPDIALVEIGNHPINPDQIKYHYKLGSGLMVFGSKRLEKADEISQHNFIINKHDFNRLEYPLHILRIGMFDLWIGNRDRRGDNFNLFLSQAQKQKLYVFDHFEAFAKITESSQNDIPFDVDAFKRLLGTSYGYEMLQWIKMDDLKHEMNKFLNLIKEIDADAFLASVVNELPSAWDVSDKTINYIKRFLLSDKRQNRIKAAIRSYIKYLPSKL